MALQDLRERAQQAQLDLLGREQRAQSVKLVRQAQRVAQVQVVPQVDLQGLQVRRAQRGSLAQRGRKAEQAAQDPREVPVRQVQAEHRSQSLKIRRQPTLMVAPLRPEHGKPAI